VGRLAVELPDLDGFRRISFRESHIHGGRHVQGRRRGVAVRIGDHLRERRTRPLPGHMDRLPELTACVADPAPQIYTPGSASSLHLEVDGFSGDLSKIAS
jgi:hypothetical protein